MWNIFLLIKVGRIKNETDWPVAEPAAAVGSLVGAAGEGGGLVHVKAEDSAGDTAQNQVQVLVLVLTRGANLGILVGSGLNIRVRTFKPLKYIYDIFFLNI